LLKKKSLRATKDSSKAELVAIYVTGTPQPVNQQEEMPLNDEELEIVFNNYCQIGNPTNTRLLKSSLFVKLMRDCGLIQGEALRTPEARQLSLREIDLAFTKICTVRERSPTRGARSLAQSQEFSTSLTSSERRQKIYMTHTKLTTVKNKKRLH